MSTKDQPLGELTITFKGRKPEDGDILLNKDKRRFRKKGETISGAAKMKSQYKTRMANKSAKRAAKKR